MTELFTDRETEPQRRDWLAGVPGFEPGHGGIKIHCLTAWLHPNLTNATFLRRQGFIWLFHRGCKGEQRENVRIVHPACTREISADQSGCFAPDRAFGVRGLSKRGGGFLGFLAGGGG